MTDPDETKMETRPRAAVVVAHPDDEVLWCGGYILSHPEYLWRIVTLCRAGDEDRATKFFSVVQHLKAEGMMADLEDGTKQTPLPQQLVQETIVRLLHGRNYALMMTHGPKGEYTNHRRHEECCHAVVELWQSARIATHKLMMFSYEDGGGTYLPRVCPDADLRDDLTTRIWLEKRRMITGIYGYQPESWEARCIPRQEGFWQFDTGEAAMARIEDREHA